MTKLTELLGIKYPIIQGGMAWISESNLVSAVSNAGGAGVIGTGGGDPEWVREEIMKTRKMTDKPFGVNVVLMDPNKDRLIELICELKVDFVTLGAGNPLPYLKPLQEAGIKVIPVVPNLKLAKRMEENGADGIIIEGMEAGGHIGNQTTMALMTNIIPRITGIPVIVAGGIVTGRALAAVLLMGGAGVQMGSRFLLARECQVHPNVKEKIIGATDTDSVVTGFSRNFGVRGLRNKFTDEYLALETAGASFEVLSKLAAGRSRVSAVEGDMENGSVQVGQSLVPLNKIKSVREIIEEIVGEANEALASAARIIIQ